MPGKSQFDAARQARGLLLNSLSGSSKSVRVHIKRSESISMAIWKRWHVTPSTWQVKHLRWYLSHYLKDNATTTQYDHWRTIDHLIARLNKTLDWLPHLHGSWERKDGSNNPINNTGRPKKTPFL